MYRVVAVCLAPVAAAFVPTDIHSRSYKAPLSFNPLRNFATKTEEELLPEIRDAIRESSADDEKIWEEAIDIVSNMSGMKTSESEMCLAKAFGWRAYVVVTSKFARRYIKTSIPDTQQLKQALEWSLSGPLGFTQDRLKMALALNPDVYLIDPSSTYETVLSVAPKEYQDPEAFRELACEDPSALGCTFNCVDSGCSSECGNCWVSFANKS